MDAIENEPIQVNLNYFMRIEMGFKADSPEDGARLYLRALREMLADDDVYVEAYDKDGNCLGSFSGLEEDEDDDDYDDDEGDDDDERDG